MILLITPSPNAGEWAGSLQAGTGEIVKTASSLRDGVQLLRDCDFNVVVYDEHYVEGIALGAESLLAQCGMAAPVCINLSITRIERVVREVSAAIKRVRAERTKAHKVAAAALRGDLNSALTGILLSADLALNVGPLPALAASRLKEIQHLAQNMRQHLDESSARDPFGHGSRS